MSRANFQRDAEQNWTLDECSAAIEHFVYLKESDGLPHAADWMRGQIAHLSAQGCDIAQHFSDSMRAELDSVSPSHISK